MNTTEKYGGLKLVALIVRIFAWIVLVVGIGAAIGAYTGARSELINASFMQALGAALLAFFLVGFINFVYLYIISGLVSVGVDVENNTRATTEAVAQLQRAMVAKLEAPPPPPPPT